MINEERVLKHFLELVQIDSESGQEEEFAGVLVKELQDLGLQVWTDNAGEKVGATGNNVYGYLPGDLDIEPLLFSSHMDTVVPGNGIKPVIKDNVIYSSGDTILASDDKSGVVAILEALRVIKEKKCSHGPIEVVFTISEEVGLKGSKNLEYNKLKSKKAYVLDSSGDVGKIIRQAPAQNKLIFKVIGKSAHAGVAPEEGISAIQVAAEAVSKMKLLRIDEETTANIGSFKGGVATNIVCPEVEIVAETRSLDNEKVEAQTNHMIRCFQDAAKKFGAKVEYEVDKMYQGYTIPDDDMLVALVKKACDNLEIKANPTSSGGGSDANIYNGNGIQAVNLGTGMSKVHTVEEYITLENLFNCAKLTLDLMLRGE